MVAVSTRINGVCRGALPVLLTLLLALLAYLPYGSSEISRMFPQFALISVFFWSVYQPNLMPAGAAFLIGFFIDVLSGIPLGLTALTLVFLQYASLTQRPAFVGRPFLVGWIGFAVFAAAAMAFIWLGASLFYWVPFDPAPVAIQLAITVAVYPLIAEVFGWMQRKVLR